MTDESVPNTCDHLLQKIYVGSNNENKCSGCRQSLSDSQVYMMTQKVMVLIKGELEKSGDK
ncbi:MAG: hypothetical protein O6761_05860 [Thaumarchaeota archaeon]|nr:hypothetical protein [Nitrososphaerota archaeon]